MKTKSHAHKKYKRVILIEMNEISKEIIDELISKGELQNFKFLQNHYKYFRTVIEERAIYWEPWIQWVSVHTGKKYADHKIFDLGSSEFLQAKQIFETLSKSGIESAIVGSMNVRRGSMEGGFFFPDPWAKNLGEVYPNEFKPLWEYISNSVHQKGYYFPNPIQLFQIILLFFRLRISPLLCCKIIFQLLSQKLFKLKKWKLASFYDEFFVDIFIYLLKKREYGFYTLFLNSVAHYQHHFWRNYDSNGFSPHVKSPNCHNKDNPIAFGVQKYDLFLRRIFSAAKCSNDTLIVIASALSQEPYYDSECEGGMNYYRLMNHKSFIKRIGFDDLEIFPLMSRDWEIRSKNELILVSAAKFISELIIEKEPLFKVRRISKDIYFIQTSVTKSINCHSVIFHDSKPVCEFGDYFRNMAVKSGEHIEMGHLWISEITPDCSGNVTQPIPLTDVHDLVLKALI